MKKLVYLIIAMLVLGLIISGCSLLGVAPTEKDETTSLIKVKPADKPPSGAHFNLNIIGKKSDWSGGGNYNNEDRHTMFVPEDTTEFLDPDTGFPCLTPNGEPGVTIEITQCGEECDDFAVLDGNAFDDCTCKLRLAPGKYEVWMVVKAKPPKQGEDYFTYIAGWIRYTDPDTGYTEYFKNIGSVTVRGKKWLDASDIIYVSCDEDDFGIVAAHIGCNGNGLGMWVFEYLALLESEEGMEDTAYFWQYDNHGNKLVKVRFYEK